MEQSYLGCLRREGGVMSNQIIIPNSARGGSPVGQRIAIDKVKIAKGLSVYYDRAETPVEQTMDAEALKKLHEAIRYTHSQLSQESYDKMNEEIPISEIIKDAQRKIIVGPSSHPSSSPIPQ